MRKLILSIILLIAILGVTSCSRPGRQAAQPTGLRVGIVTSSGVDDGSFGQDCYIGIRNFISTHPDAQVTAITEPDMSRLMPAVSSVIANFDVLVLPGFQFARIGNLAQENPDRKIILVDVSPQDDDGTTVELDNVYSMTFQEEESGFFAGIIAALETRTNRVAVVNGMAFPSNVNYQFGFMSGVNYANTHLGTTVEIVELPPYAGRDVRGVAVGGNYIGGFADEVTGKVVGNALINAGVDIMLVAAGASGNGVFTAAKEATGIFVIGCDVDQFDDGAGAMDGRNVILTSVLKIMNTNVTRQLTAIANGTFVGRNELLSASTDSTGFVSAPGRHQMSESTLARLAEIYPLVNSGVIVPAANFNGHTPDNFPGLRM